MKVVLALVLLMLPTALAGPGNGTDLVPGDNTWYVHVDDTSGEYWMSNAKDEAGHYEGGYGTGSPAANVPGAYVYFEYPLRPAPERDIQVDTDEKIDMTIVLGGSGDTRVGYLAVEPYIWVDDELFASGEVIESPYMAEYVTLTWSLTPLLATIPAGSEVVWEIRVGGVYNGVFIRMDDAVGWTQATIPVLPPEAACEGTELECMEDLDGSGAIEVEVTGDAPVIEQDVAEEHAGTVFRYIWETDAEAIDVAWAFMDDEDIPGWSIHHGGDVVHAAESGGPAEGTTRVATGPGSVSLQVATDSFTGTYRFELSPAEVLEEAATSSTTTTTTTSASTTTSTTSSDPGEVQPAAVPTTESDASPGVALVGVLAVLGGLLVRRRL